MKKFSDFKIKVENSGFVGDKIKITKVLNREIKVHGFKVDASKYNTGNCLSIQIEIKGVKHVVFTGSRGLIELIQKVPKDGFPFLTTIIQENEMYLFM
jgi:hypothetical protein